MWQWPEKDLVTNIQIVLRQVRPLKRLASLYATGGRQCFITMVTSIIGTKYINLLICQFLKINFYWCTLQCVGWYSSQLFVYQVWPVFIQERVHHIFGHLVLEVEWQAIWLIWSYICHLNFLCDLRNEFGNNLLCKNSWSTNGMHKII